MKKLICASLLIWYQLCWPAAPIKSPYAGQQPRYAVAPGGLPAAAPQAATTPAVIPAPTPQQVGSNRWVLPDGNKRLDQVCFLTAHNAYSNIEEGFKLGQQQYWSIQHQLDNGVRGLMLDTYFDYPNVGLTGTLNFPGIPGGLTMGGLVDLQVLADTIADLQKKVDAAKKSEHVDTGSASGFFKSLGSATAGGVELGPLEATLAAAQDVWNKNQKPKQILLCHGSCRLKDVFVQKASGYERPFGETMQTIVNWLNAHPQEIVVLDCENYVENITLSQFILAQPYINMIFTPMDFKNYSATEYAAQRWPTLNWLRANNKRLIIFNEDHTGSIPLSRAMLPGMMPYQMMNPALHPHDPVFFVWDWCIESQYGVTDFAQACQQRGESLAHAAANPNRNLFIQNFFLSHNIFEDLKLGQIYSAINSYDNLKRFIQGCKMPGVPAGKRPNFLALDFVNYGDGMRVVNEINAGTL